MACFLQTLSETAMRPGELWQLCWSDYDKPTGTISVTPEKGSKSGTYKVFKELAQMLEALPRKYGDRIFSKPGCRWIITAAISQNKEKEQQTSSRIPDF